jgi:hypothetical protein
MKQSQKSNPNRFDRVPPQDVDAERALLGAMIYGPNGTKENIKLAIQIGVIPEIFYKESHQGICTAIYNVYEKNIGVDLLTVVKELGIMGQLDKVDVGYLDEMIDSTPNSANLKYYADIVQEEALRRAIIQRSVELYNDAFDSTSEIPYLIKQHQESLTNINELYGKNGNNKYGYTAKELEHLDLPEPEWIVKNYIPFGLSMLAGSPKMGKSFWTLDLAIAIAMNGYFLGNIQVDSYGDVLYLALEDTFRRIKNRLSKTIPEGDYPDNLEFWTEIPKFNSGGMAKLEMWVKTKSNPKLIIIDVFQKIRDIKGNRNSNAYEDDYEELGRIKRFADNMNVAVLCVHHTRKADASDFLDPLMAQLH